MSEVLSIRNPEDLSEYPGLSQIREAVIHSYDSYTPRRSYSARKRAVGVIKSFLNPNPYNGGYSYNVMENFFKENNLLPLEGNNLNAASTILINHFELMGTCKYMSELIVDYLRTNYPEMDSYVIHTPNNIHTKYFLSHYGNVVHIDGHYYFLSTSNIFNSNFKTPKLNAKPFDRLTGVIHAKDYYELINKVMDLEGGQWPTLEELILENYGI